MVWLGRNKQPVRCHPLETDPPTGARFARSAFAGIMPLSILTTHPCSPIATQYPTGVERPAMKRPTAPAQPPETHPAPANDDQLGLERLIFFSDAVFAIAVTLLALDLRLDTNAASLSNAELLKALLAIWPKYLGYVISFVVLSTFWMSHHRKFRYIKRYDQRLMWINTLLLMTVAFVPFPTLIVSQYGNQTATIFYALSMTAAGLVSTGLWWYATAHHRLVDPDLDPWLVRHDTWYTLVTPAVFLASVGLAFLDTNLAQYSWLLIAPAALLLRDSRTRQA